MEPEGFTQPLLLLSENDNHDTVEETQLEGMLNTKNLMVFVAVPCGEDVSRLSSHDDDEDDDDYKLLQDSTFTDNHESQKHHHSSFRFASIMIGLLTGCFLQLSSLGTNFVVTTLPWMYQYKETLFILSLCWTSVLGITVFRIGTVLLSKTATITTTRSSTQVALTGPRSPPLAWSEPTMAIASLVGVCLSWIVTDIVLGFHVQFMHYIVSLLVPTAWCKFISYFVTKVEEEEEDEDDEEAEEKEEEDDALVRKLTHPCNTFKWYGLALGWIIGLLIQYSSLGASFVLNTWSLVQLKNHQTITITSNNNNSIHGLEWSDRTILFYSMIWSFVTNGMGVAILYYFRKLILSFHHMASTTRTRRAAAAAEDDNDEESGISLLLNHVFDLECYFAFGALAGVNMGWISTEALLGLPFGWEKHMLLCLFGIAFCRFWMSIMQRQQVFEQQPQQQFRNCKNSSIPREVITIV